MQIDFYRWRLLSLTVVLHLLSACGVGSTDDATDPNEFSIGGTVTGLAAGSSLELRNGIIDHLSITGNGNFAFKQKLRHGGSYSVVVSVNPSGQVCNIQNAMGSNVVSNIQNVYVDCTKAARITGVVAGLISDTELELSVGSLETLALTSNGDFSFNTLIPYGTDYPVTIKSQPSGQICNASNGFGTAFEETVTNVHVSCGTVGNKISIGASLSPQDAKILNVQAQSDNPIVQVSVTLNEVAVGALSSPNQYCGWHGHFISWSCDQRTFPYNAYFFIVDRIDAGCSNKIAVTAHDAAGHQNSLIIAPCLTLKSKNI